MTESVKNDSLKPDYLTMLKGIDDVVSYGAKKYGQGNWRQSIGTDKHHKFYNRLLAAAVRHLLRSGFDEESGLPHIDHAITCLYMAREYELAEPKLLEKISNFFTEDSSMAKSAKTTKKAAPVKGAVKKKPVKKKAGY